MTGVQTCALPILTGDENTVDIDFVVYWRIRDAAQYLFNIQNPDNTVKEVAESAMREVVGKSKVQDVLTEKRSEIERLVKDLTQRVLDSYNSGIRVAQLQLQRAEAPSQVVDAFRDVAAAAIDQRRIQNQAEAGQNGPGGGSVRPAEGNVPTPPTGAGVAQPAPTAAAPAYAGPPRNANEAIAEIGRAHV